MDIRHQSLHHWLIPLGWQRKPDFSHLSIKSSDTLQRTYISLYHKLILLEELNEYKYQCLHPLVSKIYTCFFLLQQASMSTKGMLRRFLGLICLVFLVLSAGSEARGLKPRTVRDVRGTSNWTTFAEEGVQRDTQRLSPGGPDAHHH